MEYDQDVHIVRYNLRWESFLLTESYKDYNDAGMPDSSEHPSNYAKDELLVDIDDDDIEDLGIMVDYDNDDNNDYSSVQARDYSAVGDASDQPQHINRTYHPLINGK